MKRNTRKGFTGIELVIVIAIIAILAASLIPAFGGLIDGANKTADLQGAREMDAAIKMGALGKNVDLQGVIEILDEAGFDITSLKPLYKGHKFYWSNEGQTIVLYDDNAKKVAYPEGQLYAPANGEELMSGACFFVTEVTTADAFYAAIENGTSITLTADIDIEKPGNISFTGKNIKLDLAGFKLNLPTYWDGQYDRHDYVEVKAGAQLTIVGGEINARGIMVRDGATLVIEGTKINALDKDGGAGINAKAGSTVTVKDTEIVVVTDGIANTGAVGHQGATAVWNNGGAITLENCTISNANEHTPYIVNNQGGTTTVNGGTYTTYAGLFSCTDGEVSVNGGNFTWHENTTSQQTVYVSETGKVTINAEANIVNGTDGGELDIWGIPATDANGVMTVTKK